VIAEPAATLRSLGWDDRVAARWADIADADRVPGRVVRVDRGACLVGTGGADVHARTPAPVAVGDWVAVRGTPDDAAVVAVADRWSALQRRDPSGRTQLLAVNVDLVFVTAPADRLSLTRVERETVMGWDSGARPVVLLTKCDLAAPGTHDDVAARLVGVDVIAVSIMTGQGVREVAALLQPSATGVLLGPSGAGKSSLANALLGTSRLPTAEVRAGDRRGRHTTAVRELVPVPGGGVLIDTPGLRSLSLALDHGGLAAGFPEIAALARSCRFGDCTHEHEPDCAVTEAVRSGGLPGERLASYHKLRRALAFEARRDDPLAQQAERDLWKQRMKDYRRRGGKD
jgi:ribosome biogenesis GTPase / thiamine phosphate phosphatase